MTAPTVDHTTKARERLLWQYRNSPKLIAWNDILPEIVQREIEAPLAVVRDILNIDEREGAQLDIIGALVNQPRDGVGDDDAIYRLLLKARVFKNTSDTRVDSIARAVGEITGSEVFRVVDNQDMTFSLEFNVPLDDQVAAILTTQDLVPRPQGVRLIGFVAPPEEDQWWGFKELDGVAPDNLAGFGELGLHTFTTDGTSEGVLHVDDEHVLGVTAYDDQILPEDGGGFAELFEVQ